MNHPRALRERIVDTALILAAERHWEHVRLHEIAAVLDISLNDIRSHFREKEDIADAWFDRADAAMLRAAEAPGFAQQSSRERIHTLIMAWLDALAAHRRPTREIIFGKLEPGHLHVQLPALLRISRSVQWVREAAGHKTLFLRRALEESALTALYLACFIHWMRDDSANSQRTHHFLAARLACAESLEHAIFRTPKPDRLRR